jgi:hypothetical protein
MALHFTAIELDYDLDIDTGSGPNAAAVHLFGDGAELFFGRDVVPDGTANGTCVGETFFMLVLDGEDIVGHLSEDDRDAHRGGVRHVDLFPNRLVVRFDESGTELVGHDALEVVFAFEGTLARLGQIGPDAERVAVPVVLRDALAFILRGTGQLVDHTPASA